MSIFGAQGLKTGVATTTAKFDLLERAANSKGEWVYARANLSSIPAYSLVKIDNDGLARTLTTGVAGTEPELIGIAQTTFADGDYGWFWVGSGGGLGKGIKVSVLVSCVTNVPLYTTTTAGYADDTATTLIRGLTIVISNPSAGADNIECFAPGVLSVN